MAKNKFFFFMLVFLCVLVISWASYGMISGGKEEVPYEVSVIVNDSNNDRWIALRQGLEQAAKDYHIALNYVSTGRLKNSVEELALIRREVENGAQGVIVQAISDESKTLDLTALSVQAEFVLLESGAGLDEFCTVIGPDNVQIGKALAEALIHDFAETLSGKKIGILSGNSSILAMQQRQKGLEAGLQGQKTTIIWNFSNIKGHFEEEQEQLAQMETADIIIALDNDGTERMIDVLLAEDEEPDCSLYGVGGSEKAVYYLDKGVIKTLVVPNEFKMGYQSLEAVAKRLKHYAETEQDYGVDYLVINQTNMYDKKNQKLLFPIVQ